MVSIRDSNNGEAPARASEADTHHGPFGALFRPRQEPERIQESKGSAIGERLGRSLNPVASPPKAHKTFDGEAAVGSSRTVNYVALHSCKMSPASASSACSKTLLKDLWLPGRLAPPPFQDGTDANDTPPQVPLRPQSFVASSERHHTSIYGD